MLEEGDEMKVSWEGMGRALVNYLEKGKQKKQPQIKKL